MDPPPATASMCPGDPGLYVDFRDERRALLFDLGDISVLPPRKLMRLSHIFVTHTHMDHFSGFDHLLRVVLGRKAQVVLFGGARLCRPGRTQAARVRLERGAPLRGRACDRRA